MRNPRDASVRLWLMPAAMVLLLVVAGCDDDGDYTSSAGGGQAGPDRRQNNGTPPDGNNAPDARPSDRGLQGVFSGRKGEKTYRLDLKQSDGKLDGTGKFGAYDYKFSGPITGNRVEGDYTSDFARGKFEMTLDGDKLALAFITNGLRTDVIHLSRGELRDRPEVNNQRERELLATLGKKYRGQWVSTAGGYLTRCTIKVQGRQFTATSVNSAATCTFSGEVDTEWDGSVDGRWQQRAASGNNPHMAGQGAFAAEVRADGTLVFHVTGTAGGRAINQSYVYVRPE
jgi:hypothetical protein